MVVLTRDVRIQKEYESKLEHFALHDPLTGLPNRRLFNEQLIQALEDAKESKDELAVIMMDIDHFKHINDEMGHDIGDEFAIILPAIGSVNNAESIAKEIQQSIKRPWNMNGKSLKVTTSMGIAMNPSEGATSFSMLKNADIALYEAKNAGRSSYKLPE